MLNQDNVINTIHVFYVFFSDNYTLTIVEFTDIYLTCVVYEFNTNLLIATLQTYTRHGIFHNENNIVH